MTGENENLKNGRCRSGKEKQKGNPKRRRKWDDEPDGERENEFKCKCSRYRRGGPMRR